MLTDDVTHSMVVTYNITFEPPLLTSDVRQKLRISTGRHSVNAENKIQNLTKTKTNDHGAVSDLIVVFIHHVPVSFIGPAGVIFGDVELKFFVNFHPPNKSPNLKTVA